MRALLAFLLLPALAFAASNGPEGAERILGQAPVPTVPNPPPQAIPPAGRADSVVAAPDSLLEPLPRTSTGSATTANVDSLPGDSLGSSKPAASAPAILPLVAPKVAPVLAAPAAPSKPTPSYRTIAIGMDTTGRSRTGRSTWTAVGLTLLLPGSGHRYLGHRTGAAVWMTTDLVNWSALLVAARLGTLYLEDATEIANRHAGANLPADADPAFLEVVRDWRSRRPVEGRRDSYDEALLQQGLSTDSRFPNDAAHDWDWGSPENPENNRNIGRFEDALKGYRTSRLALSYAAGALLLSRTVAVADILRIRRKSASRAGLQAVVVPGPDGGTAVLSLRF